MMLVGYHPKPGKGRQLEALVRKHWPTLDRLGLVTPEPAEVWRARDKAKGAVHFVERFSWKGRWASDLAHRTPEVLAVWEPMGRVLEKLQLTEIEPLGGRRPLSGRAAARGGAAARRPRA